MLEALQRAVLARDLLRIQTQQCGGGIASPTVQVTMRSWLHILSQHSVAPPMQVTMPDNTTFLCCHAFKVLTVMRSSAIILTPFPLFRHIVARWRADRTRNMSS